MLKTTGHIKIYFRHLQAVNVSFSKHIFCNIPTENLITAYSFDDNYHAFKQRNLPSAQIFFLVIDMKWHKGYFSIINCHQIPKEF